MSTICPSVEKQKDDAAVMTDCHSLYPEHGSGGSIEAVKVLPLQSCSFWVHTAMLQHLCYLPTIILSKMLGRSYKGQRRSAVCKKLNRCLRYTTWHRLFEWLSRKQSSCSDLFTFI